MRCLLALLFGMWIEVIRSMEVVGGAARASRATMVLLSRTARFCYYLFSICFNTLVSTMSFLLICTLLSESALFRPL
jgi:hypothetical protein